MGLALVIFVMQYQKRMVQQNEELKDKEALHQKKMLSATIESQEKERSRIASNLHDSLGAQLSTVRLNVLMHGQKHSESLEFAENVAELLADTIQEMRKISHDLLPGALESYGLLSAWKELIHQIDDATPLRTNLRSEGTVFRMSGDRELALYRISQELINNTIKHAKAQHIHLSIAWGEEQLSMVYEDDGQGFDTEENNAGLGMYTLQSRAQSLGGELTMVSHPGAGMKCTVTIPSTAPLTDIK